MADKCVADMRTSLVWLRQLLDRGDSESGATPRARLNDSHVLRTGHSCGGLVSQKVDPLLLQNLHTQTSVWRSQALRTTLLNTAGDGVRDGAHRV